MIANRFPAISFLAGFVLCSFSNCALAFGPATTCEELPVNLSQIKANVESHQRAMTDEDIEQAITDLTNFNGRSYRRNYAELAKRLDDDINNWIETASKCISVNPDALYEAKRICDEPGKKAYEEKWKAKIAASQDKYRTQVAGRSIAARLRAKCFASYEEKLLSPYRNAKKINIPTTKVVVEGFPLPVFVPVGYQDSSKEVYGDIKSFEKSRLFCEPNDATLMRDQLRGNRIGEYPEKGCISIAVDDRVKIDPNTGKFSVEDLVSQLSAVSKLSDKADSKVMDARRESYGVYSTYSYTHEVRQPDIKLVTNAFYVYDYEKSRVWAVSYSFTNRCQDGLCQSIWYSLLDGMKAGR